MGFSPFSASSAKPFKALYSQLTRRSNMLRINFKSSDDEHAEMIRLYIEEGLSIGAIAEKLGRSSRTPVLQIHKHDEAVKRTGFCPACRRV